MDTRPTHSRWHVALLAGLIGLVGGCYHTAGVVVPPPPDGAVPTELNPVILPRYVIAPPDIVYVQVLQPPYTHTIPTEQPKAGVDPTIEYRGYYSNPRVDQLLLEGRSTFDRAKRKPKYEEVQKIIATELPYISLYMQSNVAIMRSNIDGYVQYPAGFYLSVPQMTMK